MLETPRHINISTGQFSSKDAELSIEKQGDKTSLRFNNRYQFLHDPKTNTMQTTKLFQYPITGTPITTHIPAGKYGCGDCTLEISVRGEYARLRFNGKHDFWFDKNGTYDGWGQTLNTKTRKPYNA